MPISTPRPVILGTAAAVALMLLTACATDQPPADDPTTSASPTPTAIPTEVPESPEPTPAEGVVVNGPNTLEAPAPGATVEGPTVTVSGEGTAFEATLNYRVLVAGTDQVVDEGWTMAGANGEIGPYSIELTLDPGEYTVQVWEPDMSDGESPDGPFRNLVEVTFTVT